MRLVHVQERARGVEYFWEEVSYICCGGDKVPPLRGFGIEAKHRLGPPVLVKQMSLFLHVHREQQLNEVWERQAFSFGHFFFWDAGRRQ